MQRLLEAADEIHSAALQILNHYEVDAKAVPLVMATAAQRLEQFAIGAMARELSALDGELAELRKQEDKEVEDGGHITGD